MPSPMPVETVRPPAVGDLLARLEVARQRAAEAKAASSPVALVAPPAAAPLSLADVERLLADRDAFWRAEIAAGTAALRGLIEVAGQAPADEWDMDVQYDMLDRITKIKLKAVRP